MEPQARAYPENSWLLKQWAFSPWRKPWPPEERAWPPEESVFSLEKVPGSLEKALFSLEKFRYPPGGLEIVSIFIP
jgi:hypothetical protein